MTDDEQARHAQVDEASRRAQLLADWMTAQQWQPTDVSTKLALLMALCVVALTGIGSDLTRLLRFVCDVWDEAHAHRQQSILESVVSMMHARAAAAAAADDDDDEQDDDPLPH